MTSRQEIYEELIQYSSEEAWATISEMEFAEDWEEDEL